LPERKEHLPDPRYLEWHNENVIWDNIDKEEVKKCHTTYIVMKVATLNMINRRLWF
jgi:hypothetical protein